MTQAEFNKIARASIKAISWTEGWDDEHPSWVIRNGKVSASRTFKLQLLEELEKCQIRISGWNYKRKCWEMKSNENQ
jgi:hypothetical protein